MIGWPTAGGRCPVSTTSTPEAAVGGMRTVRFSCRVTLAPALRTAVTAASMSGLKSVSCASPIAIVETGFGEVERHERARGEPRPLASVVSEIADRRLRAEQRGPLADRARPVVDKERQSDRLNDSHTEWHRRLLCNAAA